MSGGPSRKNRLYSCLALALLAALMRASSEDAAAEQAGLIAIYAVSLFISVGFILFGRERMGRSGNQLTRED